MLSQIVQESVESWKEEYKDTTLTYAVTVKEPMHPIDFLISSQISLLEAELLRKKVMIIKPDMMAYGSKTENEGWNLAIQEDISYLQEQLELIKKMV